MSRPLPKLIDNRGGAMLARHEVTAGLLRRLVGRLLIELHGGEREKSVRTTRMCPGGVRDVARAMVPNGADPVSLSLGEV